MKTAMATRSKKKTKTVAKECTEFQLHKSQQTIFANELNKIIDFTEHKLLRQIDQMEDKQQQMLMMALLHDYVAGHVAIAWNKDGPVWIKVTKG